MEVWITEVLLYILTPTYCTSRLVLALSVNLKVYIKWLHATSKLKSMYIINKLTTNITRM